MFWFIVILSHMMDPCMERSLLQFVQVAREEIIVPSLEIEFFERYCGGWL
jgi:hypothetical protein